jgi:hypothetical protein
MNTRPQTARPAKAVDEGEQSGITMRLFKMQMTATVWIISVYPLWLK